MADRQCRRHFDQQLSGGRGSRVLSESVGRFLPALPVSDVESGGAA